MVDRKMCGFYSYFTAKLSGFRAEEIKAVFILPTIAIARVRRLLREVESESDVEDDGDVQRWRVSVACCPGGDPLCERGREMSPIDMDLVLGMSMKQAAGEWRRLRCGSWCEFTHVGWEREKIESSQNVMRIMMTLGTKRYNAWLAVTVMSDAELGQQESIQLMEIKSPWWESLNNVGIGDPLTKWSWKMMTTRLV